jgi:CPA2 family monovalent cation:H+ antiporter-2
MVQSIIQTIRTDRYSSVRPHRNSEWLQRELMDTETDFDSEWVVLPSTSSVVGQTLAHANLRNRTGATVMAIRRDRETMYYPNAQTTLHAGDKLLVIGERAELAAFRGAIEYTSKPPIR